jgi:hypothetical protein
MRRLTTFSITTTNDSKVRMSTYPKTSSRCRALLWWCYHHHLYRRGRKPPWTQQFAPQSTNPPNATIKHSPFSPSHAWVPSSTMPNPLPSPTYHFYLHNIFQSTTAQREGRRLKWLVVSRCSAVRTFFAILGVSISACISRLACFFALEKSSKISKNWKVVIRDFRVLLAVGIL